jgi:NADH-quinone oxidoreductase subunit N
MNWTLIVPELVLACAGMGILMFGVFRRGDTTFPCTMLTLGALLLTAVLVLATPDGSAFNGQFRVDAFATFAKMLILLGAALALMLALDFNRQAGLARFEYPVLLLFSVCGMMLMVSATDLLTLYLGFELQSLALYVLAAIHRDDQRSSEAGLKYFVLGALASGLLLYGMSLVYGFAGTTSFDGIAQALRDPAGASTGLVVGVVFVVAGLCFKVSAVPFHMWTPDVYQGAPTPVTAFFATAPKIAATALFLRVLAGPFGALEGQWQQLIVLVSIGSMVLGSLAAIGQSNIKRLMAYSSIGHMGYALIGLAAANQAGIRGVLVYLAIYLIMNAGAFAAIVAMRRDGRALERIEDLRGLGRTDPAMALAVAVAMFSMAGIPPLAGFFAKLYVFLAAVQAGLWTLAVIGVVTSVIGAYYYLRIVKVMYFDEPAPAFDPRPAALSVVLAGTGLFTALYFVLPAPLVAAAAAAARALGG